MGIGVHGVEALIREHQYKPISGDVAVIGRQTVYFSPEALLDLFESNGSARQVQPSEMDIDRSTVYRLPGFEGQDLVSDFALFRLLDVPHLLAIDHSDYEGAEIIHDLNKPIPESLRGSLDFIYDGSTLDNTFDPALVIRNLADLLRPGGRIVQTNVFSNVFEPYVIPSPLWYIDFYAANGFLDCKVYIIVQMDGSDNVYYLDPSCLADKSRRVSQFVSPHTMTTLVIAEKGPHSSSAETPSQQHYRSDEEWGAYRNKLRPIVESTRPHICRSHAPLTFRDVRAGHLFINDRYEACDPATEMMRLDASRASAAG